MKRPKIDGGNGNENKGVHSKESEVQIGLQECGAEEFLWFLALLAYLGIYIVGDRNKLNFNSLKHTQRNACFKSKAWRRGLWVADEDLDIIIKCKLV